MKSDEKAGSWPNSKPASCKVLLATTVVEVGVDVPNATLMVIENPERMGLAQLHQLRGPRRPRRPPPRCVLLYAASAKVSSRGAAPGRHARKSGRLQTSRRRI